MKKILFALFLAFFAIFFQPSAYFMYSAAELQALRDSSRTADAVESGDLETFNSLITNYNSHLRPDVLAFLTKLAENHGQTAIIERIKTVATQNGVGEQLKQFVKLIAATEAGDLTTFSELFTTLRAQMPLSFVAGLKRVAIARNHDVIIEALDSMASY